MNFVELKKDGDIIYLNTDQIVYVKEHWVGQIVIRLSDNTSLILDYPLSEILEILKQFKK